MMKAPSLVANRKNKPPCLAGTFYDNYQPAGCTYRAGIGWEISDGAPINTEYTPGNQIVSLKSGVTKWINVGVGFGAGLNGATVILDRDCKGVPCGIIDSSNLCKGSIKGMPKFGTSGVSMQGFRCVAQLVKGQPYWVYIQSRANSWLAWNYSKAAVGGLIWGTSDVWGAPSGGQPVGALQIF